MKWYDVLIRFSSLVSFFEVIDLQDFCSFTHFSLQYLMVDIVVNHHGWSGSENSVVYSDFYPFNQASYYHPYCAITNYDNQTNVEDCWLGDSNVELVDLKTEDPIVASMYQTWITQLVSNYSSKFEHSRRF